MAKIKIGDLVRVELLNDMYMWVHVLFDSQLIVKGKKEVDPCNYFYFYVPCYLINIYSQISTEEELKDDMIFFKDVFIPRKRAVRETIISNIPVDYRQIGSPEHVGGLNSSFWLSKGELALGSILRGKIHEWNDRLNEDLRDIYSVADSLPYMQDKQSEVQRANYPDTWKLIPRNFRFYPEYKKKVYGTIGEDPSQSHYELTLKHGFDLARFYTDKKQRTMNYPEEIMHDVAWNFVGMQYRSQKQSIEVVNGYNEKLEITRRWSPCATATQCKEVTIQYSYWSGKENEEVEENFNLISATPAFTNVGLLFEIHDFVVDKLKHKSNHFFEGLTLWEGENSNSLNVPLYFLMQGD